MENKDLDKMPKKSPFSFQVDLSKFEKATDEEKRQQEVMSESSTSVSYTHLDVYKRQII